MVMPTWFVVQNFPMKHYTGLKFPQLPYVLYPAVFIHASDRAEYDGNTRIKEMCEDY